MKNKLLVAALAGIVLTMVLPGCGSSQPVSETDEDQEMATQTEESKNQGLESGKVELTVWAEESNFDMLNGMIDSFKQNYAGQADFDIKLEANSDGMTRDKLLGDVHNGADIFPMADDQLLSMIAAGVLSPVPDSEEVSSANVAESIAAASYKDTLYAYPYTADNGYLLYYDKNYLSEADVQTLDGILAVAQEAGKKVSMDLSSGWYLYSFFGQTGMELGLNPDGVTNYCNWNTTEGAIKGTDVAEAMLQITANPAFISQSDDQFIEGVMSGDVIAGVSGAWQAVTIRDKWGDDYGACKLPTYTCAGKQVQMASFTGYKMMGVNSYSDHVEWAHKLAQWLTNEQNQIIRFEQKNQGPSNIKAAASDEVKHVPALKALSEQAQYGNLQRVSNYYWNACTDFGSFVVAGNPNGRILQDVMDKLVSGITASAVQ